MSIFRSTDPTTWDDVDQVVISEETPPGSVSGVAANIAGLVGRFERGPDDQLFEIGNTQQLLEVYGADDTKSGNLELKNKRFGRLKIARVVASGAAKATYTALATATPIIKFDAKYKGTYGNNLKVTIAAATGGSGKKYTITDTNATAVIAAEVYDNVVITAIDASTFGASKLVDVTVLATSSDPDNIALTSLAAGSAGSEADTDYDNGLALMANDGLVNIAWADKQSVTIKNALEQHVLNNPNKMVIMAPDSSAVAVAAAVTEVASYRSDRIIYAYPYVKSFVNGTEITVAPASWMASIISQNAPQIDPASALNAKYQH